MPRQYKPFHFKQFEIQHQHSAMKVGTDAVMLGAWSQHPVSSNILDIGTGTGVMAIMLAQRYPKAQVTGVEIEPRAAKEATQNAANAPFSNRILIENTSFQAFCTQQTDLFDHIICNPPFFVQSTLSGDFAKDTARHTHSLSMDELIAGVVKLLTTTGHFSCVYPVEEAHLFIDKAACEGLFLQRRLEVKPKKEKNVERFLMQFGKEKTELQNRSLIIQHEARNDWTADYIELTKDFYLGM